MIEAAGQVARHFDMLDLVLADGHDVGVIDQDVGRHEHRIGEQPGVGAEPAGLLVLVGNAAFQQAHGRAAEQDPAELGHLGHVRLQEQRGPIRIEPQGQQIERRVERVAPQLRGIADRCQGMQVGDEVEGRFGLILQVDVLADRAEVVAPMETPGGLDAGKNTWHGKDAR